VERGPRTNRLDFGGNPDQDGMIQSSRSKIRIQESSKFKGFWMKFLQGWGVARGLDLGGDPNHVSDPGNPGI